jgi:hypothetical protein
MILVLVSLVLSGIALRLAVSSEWGWGVGVFLALIPPGLTFLLGLYGLLGGALFLGALFKASAR